MPGRTAATVIYQGRERVLAELCREVGVDRQTVQYRLDQGMEIELALFMPTRTYPATTRKRKPSPPPPVVSSEPEEKPLRPLTPRYNRLVEDAIDLMIDVRGILIDLDTTPRRARILAGVRRWLKGAGWR